MTVDADADPAILAPSGAKFKITDTKLYLPVVTLSRENGIKHLEQLKSGLKKTIKWNKYRSQMTIQPQNNNLYYLIDSTLTKVNRLFFCHFKELLEKMIQQKIIEILFQVILYQISEQKTLMS